MFKNNSNIFRHSLSILPLLIVLLFSASAALAASESWENGESDFFSKPQNRRNYNYPGITLPEPEEEVQPLPRPAPAEQQDPLTLRWSLRLLGHPEQALAKAKTDKADISGTTDAAEEKPVAASETEKIEGAVFEDAFGPVLVQNDSGSESLDRIISVPDKYPGWLAENPLWLVITISPNIPESYFYAPFAAGLSKEELAGTADAVLPTSLEIVGDNGDPVPGVRFYFPPGTLKEDPFSGLRLPVYTREITVLAQIPPLLLGQTLQLKTNALICTDVSCIPLRKAYTLDLGKSALSTEPLEPSLALTLMDYQTAPFGLEESSTGSIVTANPSFAVETSSQHGDSRFESYLGRVTPLYYAESLEVTNIWRAVLLGLLAGLILNFMPCVLPVISLKLGTLVGLGGWSSLESDSEMARRNRRKFRLYGFCFTLGVFVWFGMLFGVIGFADLMWGQFFQSQPLILGLTLLLFVMSLSMFGLVRIPLLNVQIDGKAALPYQAFFGGLLATLLATPCSGPLLGGVLGWAVNQSILYLGITLLAVAVGMSSPFILMTISPGLAKYLPKPGPWARTLETVMGFVLMATVLYLLSMLPEAKLFIILAALLVLAFAAWLWGRPVAEGKSRLSLGRVLAVVLAVCAVYFPFTQQIPDTSWRNFSAASFQEQLGKKNILVDFTADWCINCRAMEMTTLTEQRLTRWARSHDLVYVKVDLTADNPDGQALLSSMGSASIPLLAIIPADNPDRPTVLRDLVTPGQLDDALKKTLKK